MNLNEINPYVRFARSNEGNIPCEMSVALDHRIFYCLSDSGCIEVGEKIYNLKKGSLILWKAGIPYRNLTKGAPLAAMGCNFDFFNSPRYPTAPVSYVSINEFKEEMIIEGRISEFPDCLFLSYFPYKEKFSEICEEYLKKEIFYNERCSAILKEIIFSALRMNNSKVIYKPKKSGEEILSFIRMNYNKKLNNKVIAEHFSYHPNYVSLIVKKRTGMPLHKYLTTYRINMAINLLKSGDYNVTETALKTGFYDIKHFSKVFKNITGKSPSEYII